MTMMKLVRHLRPAVIPAPVPDETAVAATETPLAASHEPALETKRPTTWGAVSQRLLGHLAAVESDGGQPSMPNHSKTSSQSR